MKFKRYLFIIFTIFSIPTMAFCAQYVPGKNSPAKDPSKWHKAMIAVILNKTTNTVKISDQGLKEMVRPGTIRLKHKFIIPFISMKAYMKYILKDVSYVPADALRLETNADDMYGIWEDERGIQACKIGRDIFHDEGVENLLSAACLEVAQALTLKINESGYQLLAK